MGYQSNMEIIFRHLRVYVWTYLVEGSRNYPGFHLAARSESCLILIAWLEQLKQTDAGITRTIPLTLLRSEQATPISESLKCRSFHKCRLTIGPERDDLEQMVINADGDRVNQEITYSQLPELIQGLRDVSHGIGDYAMTAKSPFNANHRESQKLWFWPCFGEFWENA